MAKILTGPLAARLSGRLGPIVFYQTRFGQVVASKGRTRVHTTPAALQVKEEFRQAAQAWSKFLGPERDNFEPIAALLGKHAGGEYIRAYLQTLRTGSCTPRLVNHDHLLVEWLPPEQDATWWIQPFIPTSTPGPLYGGLFVELAGDVRAATGTTPFFGPPLNFRAKKDQFTPPFLILAWHAWPFPPPPGLSIGPNFAGWVGHIWTAP